MLEGVRSLCGRPTSGPGSDCTCQADPTWTSIPIGHFGGSNLQSAGTTSFVIPSSIPDSAKEVLVYAEIETGGSGPSDVVSRLQLYTEEGSKRYEQYILVHTYNNRAWNTNSDNMWFPLMINRRLYLQNPNAHTGRVSIAVYVIGYR